MGPFGILEIFCMLVTIQTFESEVITDLVRSLSLKAEIMQHGVAVANESA